MWATSVPILVFLGLSVLKLRPVYATDKCQTKALLNAPPIRSGGITIHMSCTCLVSFSQSLYVYSKKEV